MVCQAVDVGTVNLSVAAATGPGLDAGRFFAVGWQVFGFDGHRSQRIGHCA